ncbi:hypothetical protein MYX65_13170 [Acidobacteria bacterium AH-259-L09]|nr:hypothetical protein [Acidobacteria bacterium AH-259-L09]
MQSNITKRAFLSVVLFLVFVLSSLGQVLAQAMITLDGLEREAIQASQKEVGFSATLEGTVSDGDLAVFIMVHHSQLRAWRLFRATVDTNPEAEGQFRWRAIGQFGKLDGTGIGDAYQVRAIAFEKTEISEGLPRLLPSAAPKSQVFVLSRVK